jgi:hypothetical protein
VAEDQSTPVQSEVSGDAQSSGARVEGFAGLNARAAEYLRHMADLVEQGHYYKIEFDPITTYYDGWGHIHMTRNSFHIEVDE